ncbi:MAG: Succinyl-CoA synthetase subunit alpha [Promethearchaeota archaeon]|nr:MAG: Succinyl-CoA synthetase subunit alpha [Candidatus Lokiarchaeota archaeon]
MDKINSIEKVMSLDDLFNPKTVLIFDAKPKISFFIEGFIHQGFELSNLYLNSSTEDEILGIKCYKSLEEIPIKQFDLLILSIRRELLISSLEAILSKKKIKFIHVFTAGTGESDEIGMNIEKELKHLLDANPNTRAIGPNCMGIYSPEGKVAYYPWFPIKSGNISLISQSGDLHSRIIKFANSKYQLLFKNGISIGNCVDVQIAEVLEYFNEDIETDLICVYFEGFSFLHPKSGLELLSILKIMKKPVLFMRGGITERGKKAVLSHTGSIATKNAIWDAIYKQTPIIRVPPSLEALLNYMYLFDGYIQRFKILPGQIIYPKDKKVLVILWSGGFGILATDVLMKLGLKMPHFEGKMVNELKKIYPLKIGSLANPLDLPWISDTEEYYQICKTSIEANHIDLVLVETDAWSDIENDRFKKYYKNLLKLKNFTESLNKVFILILHEYKSELRERIYKRFIRDDFLVFPNVQSAAESFLIFYEYGSKLSKQQNIRA